MDAGKQQKAKRSIEVLSSPVRPSNVLKIEKRTS
jgi:hypothetical protein